MPVAESLFRWNEAYSMNIARLDKQNQKVFEIMSQLDEAFRTGESVPRIGQILDALVNNAFAHFSAEELLMEKHGFPGLASHQAKHAEFREQIVTFLVERKVRPDVAVDILLYTQNWWKQHLLTVDKKCGAYLNEHGVH
jgi:hemerythrin